MLARSEPQARARMEDLPKRAPVPQGAQGEPRSYRNNPSSLYHANARRTAPLTGVRWRPRSFTAGTNRRRGIAKHLETVHREDRPLPSLRVSDPLGHERDAAATGYGQGSAAVKRPPPRRPSRETAKLIRSCPRM